MASQLTEFHYHLTQGRKANLFDFEDKNFDIKDIYQYYLRRVSISIIILASSNFKRSTRGQE